MCTLHLAISRIDSKRPQDIKGDDGPEKPRDVLQPTLEIGDYQIQGMYRPINAL